MGECTFSLERACLQMSRFAYTMYGGVFNRVVRPPSPENGYAINWLHCRLTCEVGPAAVE